MRLIVLDFETYYSAQHSLTKLCPIVYALHPATEILSVAVWDNGKLEYYQGEQNVQNWADSTDFSDALVVGHNMSGFDAMIAAWRLGIKPKMWGCTLAMARRKYAKRTRLSLKALARYFGIGEKLDFDEVNTRGKHLKDLSEGDLIRLRTYNLMDTELCMKLFKILAKETPSREMKLIDTTIRMLTEPALEVDVPMLRHGLEAYQKEKQRSLAALAHKVVPEFRDLFGHLNMEEAEAVMAASYGLEELAEKVKSNLSSTAKFAAFLDHMGIEIPLKPSPSNPEKLIPALAKTDDEFVALQEHENELVRRAVESRLAVRSTLFESRITRFIEVAEYTGGKMPIGLLYYGADTTGRWSGGMKLNQQNLPRIIPGVEKHTDIIRKCLRAPEGYKVVVADLSGIELRVNMTLWKVPYAMEAFKKDAAADLYKPLASDVLGVPLSELTKMMRQAGKAMHLGCFGANTQVLTSNGIKRIVDVDCLDLVWDGDTWVEHSGVVYQGEKDCITFGDTSATPDHKILCGKEWVEWQNVVNNRATFKTALSSATLPSLGGATKEGVEDTTPNANVNVGGLGWSTATLSLKAQAAGATLAPNKNREARPLQNTSRLSQMTPLDAACWGEYRQSFQGATGKQKPLTIMRPEGLLSTAIGFATGASFCGTLQPLTGGMIYPLKSTGLTTTKGTNPATSGLSAGGSIRRIEGQSQSCKKKSTILKTRCATYDVLNAGPKSRFTVIVNGEPLIVHNCGFGLGSPEKYIAVAKGMAQIDVTYDEATVHIKGYRDKHPEIVRGWKTCHKALSHIANGKYGIPIDPWGLCVTAEEGIRTPHGMIHYPNLRRQESEYEEGRMEWVYGPIDKPVRIYAGKVDENIVQHLAREVLADIILRIEKSVPGRVYRLKHTVHDELIYIVKDAHAQKMLDLVQREMRAGVAWWPELITFSEGDVAQSYGEAKS